MLPDEVSEMVLTESMKVSKEFKAFLKSVGSKTETYEDIIKRLIRDNP